MVVLCIPSDIKTEIYRMICSKLRRQYKHQRHNLFSKHISRLTYAANNGGCLFSMLVCYMAFDWQSRRRLLGHYCQHFKHHANERNETREEKNGCIC